MTASDFSRAAAWCCLPDSAPAQWRRSDPLGVAAFVGFAERGPLDTPVAVRGQRPVCGPLRRRPPGGARGRQARLRTSAVGGARLLRQRRAALLTSCAWPAKARWPNRFRIPGLVAWTSGGGGAPWSPTPPGSAAGRTRSRRCRPARPPARLPGRPRRRRHRRHPVRHRRGAGQREPGRRRPAAYPAWRCPAAYAALPHRGAPACGRRTHHPARRAHAGQRAPRIRCRCWPRRRRPSRSRRSPSNGWPKRAGSPSPTTP